MPVDERELTASLRRLAAGAGDGGTGGLADLQAVVDACVSIFGVSGSGLMVADEQDALRYVAASDGAARLLEHAEIEARQGPCTDAFVLGRLTVVDDLAADGRYPRLAAVVVPAGVRATLGIPIRLGGVTVGSLDVFRDAPHRWDDSEQQALGRYGEVVEATLRTVVAARVHGELADQLQYALDYRVVIERGVGYLMARDGTDAVTAFNRLRRAARSTRRKIGSVAEDLLGTGRLPDEG